MSTTSIVVLTDKRKVGTLMRKHTGRSKCWSPGRRLVLVDLENVVGGGVSDVGVADAAWTVIEGIYGDRDTDQVVAGVSHFSMFAAGAGRSSIRIAPPRSGPDGADLALLEVLEGEHVAERFAEVVLVSGDGKFTDEVASLGTQGVRVTVLARRGGLSRRLRMAAAESIEFEFDNGAWGDAA